MPQSKTFKVASGGRVSIYINGRPDPIEIPDGGTIETDDKAVLDALKGCPEVEEVKQSKTESKPTLRDKRSA